MKWEQMRQSLNVIDCREQVSIFVGTIGDINIWDTSGECVSYGQQPFLGLPEIAPEALMLYVQLLPYLLGFIAVCALGCLFTGIVLRWYDDYRLYRSRLEIIKRGRVRTQLEVNDQYLSFGG